MRYHPGSVLLVIPISRAALKSAGGKWNEKGSGGTQPIASSSRCPAATATLASLPPSTSVPAAGMDSRAAAVVPTSVLTTGGDVAFVVIWTGTSVRTMCGTADPLANAARHLGTGISDLVQRRRPAVHRSVHRARRREPTQRPEADRTDVSIRQPATRCTCSNFRRRTRRFLTSLSVLQSPVRPP